MGRVAGSILHAIGLPELVTDSLDDYEAKALHLARNPAELRALRDRLSRNKLTAPLFDIARFTRSLETAYQMMFDRWQTGQSPDVISVPDDVPAPIAIEVAPTIDRGSNGSSACHGLPREGNLPVDIGAPVSGDAGLAGQKFLSSQASVGIEAPRAANVQVYRKAFRIYRTLHFVWVGDKSARPDNCIETWAKLNPGWEVRIWGNRELHSRSWRNAGHMGRMPELCGVADMMRWEILQEQGGFALDADSICMRPLEEWLFEPDIFACWDNEIGRPGLIANSFVYSHPGSELVRQIIEDIHDTADITALRAWQLTGLLRLTETVRNMGYSKITIYPSHYFQPDHFTGVTYAGVGPVFGKQFWGSTIPNTYSGLRGKELIELNV